MGAAANAGYYDPGVARTRDEWLSLLGKAVVNVEDSFRSLEAEESVIFDGGLTLNEIAERSADPSSAPRSNVTSSMAWTSDSEPHRAPNASRHVRSGR